MDAARFDLLTRTLGRRGLAGLLLSLVGLGTALALPGDVSAGSPQEFCAKQPQDGRCRTNSDCCSGRCKRKKRKKGKKKKKGKCQCSQLRAPCSDVSDCCIPPAAEANVLGPACTPLVGAPPGSAAVCCMPDDATCSTAEDCCSTFSVCSSGHCVSS